MGREAGPTPASSSASAARSSSSRTTTAARTTAWSSSSPIAAGKYYEYPVEDIEKGVDALVAKGLVDPDRVGTFGWSNGSILSIAVSIANPARYKVVAAGAGDVEFISDWANVDFGQSFDAYYLGKSPLEDPELYLRISPLFQMDKVRAPTIIFFGTEDRNVPTSQGWTHYRALYHLDKVPVKFLLFPGEPHGLQEYTHQLRKLEEEMAWFDRWFFKTAKAENEALKRILRSGRRSCAGRPRASERAMAVRPGGEDRRPRDRQGGVSRSGASRSPGPSSRPSIRSPPCPPAWRICRRPGSRSNGPRPTPSGFRS
ncbi:MAG: prolyl oligopeptidase family serine peptidase [Candidatus Moduliflexus flocculans]|nr:prolyl oligopeptidase family serine peptidase [Candidatus Moduliflexus flocculans]